MISNSPGIEAMVLDTNSGYRRLRFSLPRLSYLAVSDHSLPCRKELDDLVIQDASSLERLLLHELNNGTSVRIIGATKLKMIGYLATGFPIIALNNSIFKVQHFIPASLFKTREKVLDLQFDSFWIIIIITTTTSREEKRNKLRLFVFLYLLLDVILAVPIFHVDKVQGSLLIY
jgi:hypothetical protein